MNGVAWICPDCKATVDAGFAICPACAKRSEAAEANGDHLLRDREDDARAARKGTLACPKCSGDMSMRGELRGSAGGISAVFELSNARFDYVSCVTCGYTEFYRSDVSPLGQLADLFVG